MSNAVSVIDPHQLFVILKTTEGKVKPAADILHRAGVHATEAQIRSAIENNSALRAYFGENSPVQHDLSPDDVTAMVRGESIFSGSDPIPKEQLQELAIQKQDEMIVAKGFAGIGLSSDEIAQIHSLAAVVGHGFKTTVDAAHGSTFVALMRLQARAAEITEQILKNEEEITHYAKAKDGTTFSYEGPRFTDKDKLEWQEQLTLIYDQIRRISADFNAAAKIRQQAADLELRQAELEQKKGSAKKLKKAKGKPQAGKGEPTSAAIDVPS